MCLDVLVKEKGAPEVHFAAITESKTASYIIVSQHHRLLFVPLRRDSSRSEAMQNKARLIFRSDPQYSITVYSMLAKEYRSIVVRAAAPFSKARHAGEFSYSREPFNSIKHD